MTALRGDAVRRGGWSDGVLDDGEDVAVLDVVPRCDGDRRHPPATSASTGISIFIDSSTHDVSPAATGLAGRDVDRVDRADQLGARTSWLMRSQKLRPAHDVDVVHDVLDAGVVLEPVHRQVLAVAGVLEPAVRHLGHERDVAVDPHAAEVEARGSSASPGRGPSSTPSDASPYSTPLAQRTASSSSVNRWTVMTGPKISYWLSSSSCCSPATTVGSQK